MFMPLASSAMSGRCYGVCKWRRGRQSGKQSMLDCFVEISEVGVSLAYDGVDVVNGRNRYQSIDTRKLDRMEGYDIRNTVAVVEGLYHSCRRNTNIQRGDRHHKTCSGDMGTVFETDEGRRVSRSVDRWVDHTIRHPMSGRGQRIVGERGTSW